MKNIRVLFMGTPEFAAHILAHILKENYTVVGVVTVPDKPAGRGQKMHLSAVKKYALQQNLPVYQPANLKADSFQETLDTLQPDVAVVVAFRMLPKKVWSFPKLGTFNLHASLLPDYRGAAPINWAIINGEKQTGVTTFFLDEKIDTGKIIAQKAVPITPQETAGSLHDKLMTEGAILVTNTLAGIANENIKAIAQPQPTINKEAPKLTAQNTQINWQANPQNIVDFVRGLNPYPVAWTILINGNKEWRCKIFSVEVEEKKHAYSLGKIIQTKQHLKVATHSGYILINEMQLPGKRKMPIQQILNGLRLEENAHMR